MDIQCIAGIGPIGPDAGTTHRFWSQDLGIPFDELAPDYFHAQDLGGARVFGLWPLAQAAEATFGSTEWPADLPVPQAWIELEMASPEQVGEGLEELRGRGHRILVDAHVEPWGQTTGSLLTPEGLLLGLSHMPSFHTDDALIGDDGTDTTSGTAASTSTGTAVGDGPQTAEPAPAAASPATGPASAAASSASSPAPSSPRQRIAMLARYEEQIRSGAKLQTIRVDGPFATGPADIVLLGAGADGADLLLPVEVTCVRRTSVGELTDADAQADGYPALPPFLDALRTHVPELSGSDVLDVVTYRLDD